MVRRKTCYCDICHDPVDEDWKATFFLIWGGDTVYHGTRKEREKHACNSCIRDNEDVPGLHMGNDTEWDHVRRWCMNVTNVEGILFFPEVEDADVPADITKLDKQEYWDYRPREDFNKDVESIANFIEEEFFN